VIFVCCWKIKQGGKNEKRKQTKQKQANAKQGRRKGREGEREGEREGTRTIRRRRAACSTTSDLFQSAAHSGKSAALKLADSIDCGSTVDAGI
jgi:hypothetical protein